jgi:hypothetical protein
MIGIAAGIQHVNGCSLLHSLDNRIDHIGAAAFTEVWNTFHQWLFHKFSGPFLKVYYPNSVFVPHAFAFVK